MTTRQPVPCQPVPCQPVPCQPVPCQPVPRGSAVGMGEYLTAGLTALGMVIALFL